MKPTRTASIPSAAPAASSAAKAWLVPLLAFLLAFAVFAPAITCGLVNLDDGPYITDNPLVMADSPWTALPACFTTFQQAMYAPLLWCSYALDAVLFRATPAAPWGFHLTNVLLHAANAALFALVLSRFCKNRFLVFVAAAVWAIHPLRVESVAWVTERKDVLSAFFALLATLAWLRCRCPARPAARATFFALALLLHAAALLVKVSVAPLPAVWLLLEVWPLGRIDRSSLREAVRTAALRAVALLPFFVLSLAAAALASAAHGDMGAIRAVPLSSRMASVPVHAAFYLLKTVLPLRLSPLYPDLALTIPRILGALGLLGALAAAAFRLRRTVPAMALGLLVFAVFLLPASGIVRFGIQSIADRFTYLPALGLSTALLGLLDAHRPRAPKPLCILHGALCILLAALAVLTLRLVPVWNDAVTFNDRVLRFNPTQPHALVSKADRLLEDGNPEAALPFAAEACAQRDFTLQAPLVLALVLQELDRPADALRALETTPRQATPPRQLFLLDWELARVRFALGQYDAALADATRALASLPPEMAGQRPFLHLLAMAAAHHAGRPDEALAHARAFPAYARKASIADDDLLPFHLFEWTIQHRTAHAAFFRALLAEALDSDPGLANNLLWGFATARRSPIPAAEILDAARRLVRGDAAGNPGYLDTLAAAQARAGNYAEAQATARRALDALRGLPASPDIDRFAGKLRRRLDLYRTGTPYTENAFSRWMANAWGEGLLTSTKVPIDE